MGQGYTKVKKKTKKKKKKKKNNRVTGKIEQQCDSLTFAATGNNNRLLQTA